MSVPVMRTRLKLGDISLPLVEIFDESSVVKRCEMSPSISSEAGEKASTNTMYCPHVVHLTDGGRDDCDYVTTRSNNYKRHEKEMHITVNVEQCCDLRFLYKADLKRHIQDYHCGGTVFQCLECPLSFPRKGLLERHMSVHDPSKKLLKCGACQYSTSHFSNLQRHLGAHPSHDICIADDSSSKVKQNSPRVNKVSLTKSKKRKREDEAKQLPNIATLFSEVSPNINVQNEKRLRYAQVEITDDDYDGKSEVQEGTDQPAYLAEAIFLTPPFCDSIQYDSSLQLPHLDTVLSATANCQDEMWIVPDNSCKELSVIATFQLPSGNHSDLPPSVIEGFQLQSDRNICQPSSDRNICQSSSDRNISQPSSDRNICQPSSDISSSDSSSHSQAFQTMSVTGNWDPPPSPLSDVFIGNFSPEKLSL